MSLLNDEVREETRKFLGDLADPVELVMFTREDECQFCNETRELMEEIAALSDLVTAEVFDIEKDKEKADELGIDKVPAVAVIGAEDYGVRFFGIPSGYEFTSILHSIKAVAAGETELSEESLQALSELTQPVHLQVFVTPTCPYCPPAVLLGHYMAIASPMVRSDMVEASEFPELAVKYDVMGVPRTVINETVHIEGSAPEPMVLEKLQEALASTEE